MTTDRELDILIAERIMDWVVARTDADMLDGWHLGEYQEHPSYSSGTFNFNLPWFSYDLDAAWRVVGRMQELGHYLTLRTWVESDDAMAGFYIPGQERDDVAITDSTVSLAICRAALKAIEST